MLIDQTVTDISEKKTYNSNNTNNTSSMNTTSSTNTSATNRSNFNILPKYCQTCNINISLSDMNMKYKKPQYNSFCSEECFNFASQKHCGGAILPIQMYRGEPCFILIKDGTRMEDVSELPGGKKQIYEGGGKTSAREGTEELGLKKTISYHYLENYGVRLLLWFNKTYPHHQNQTNLSNKDEPLELVYEDYVNYTVYIIAIENFDIEEANLATQSRRNDSRIKTEWKETQSIFLVPIKNLEEYSENKNDCIYDYKGNEIPPLSFRWNNFLKNKNTIKIMKEIIFSKVEPWKVRVRNKSRNESFVWTHKDLLNMSKSNSGSAFE